MIVKWIVDEYMCEATPGIIDAIDKGRRDYHFIPKSMLTPMGIDTVDLLKSIPFSNKDCVIIYGTSESTRKLRGYFIPGVYYMPEHFLCSHYIHRYPKNWVLNNDHIFVP